MKLPSQIDINKLKTWDVLLHHDITKRYKPSTWIYGLIRWVTGSDYNHSWEILIINGEVYTIESLWSGMTLTKYETLVEKSKDMKLVKALRYKHQDQFDQDDYKDKALSELYKDYDKIWLFWDMALYVLFGWWQDRDEEKSKRARWCSEFNAYMKDINGWQKFSPGDFDKHEDFYEID